MKIGAIFIIRFILMRQYNNVDIVYSLISQLCVLDTDCFVIYFLTGCLEQDSL